MPIDIICKQIKKFNVLIGLVKEKIYSLFFVVIILIQRQILNIHNHDVILLELRKHYAN